MSDAKNPIARTALIMIAGFILPGAGHFLYGERRRGLLIGLTVLALFTLGVFIGGVRVVEFPDFDAPGNLLAKLLTQPYFVGQFFAGPLALACGYISQNLAANPATAGITPHARLAEIASLYTAVAGTLNLLAIIDSTGRSANGEPPRDQGEESVATA